MRERLARGTLLESLRADPPPGIRIRTDVELDHHDLAKDLHVFGYGSLMWNPAMDVIQTGVARVQGWHRRFCLRMLLGRGTVDEPGAILALDRGGSCQGLLFRIEAAKVQAEMRLLWRREMLAGSYDPDGSLRVRAGARSRHSSSLPTGSAPDRSTILSASFELAEGRSARRAPISSPRSRRSNASASATSEWNGCGWRSDLRIRNASQTDDRGDAGSLTPATPLS